MSEMITPSWATAHTLAVQQYEATSRHSHSGHIRLWWRHGGTVYLHRPSGDHPDGFLRVNAKHGHPDRIQAALVAFAATLPGAITHEDWTTRDAVDFPVAGGHAAEAIRHISKWVAIGG